MAVLLMLLAIFFPSASTGAPSQTARGAVHINPTGGRRSGAASSCEVVAPSAYVDDARTAWCGNDLVAKVSLNTDTRNYIGKVQLSGEGTSVWMKATDASMKQIRKIVDGIADGFRMNVAVSLQSADGTTLASCTRDLLAVAASCTTR